MFSFSFYLFFLRGRGGGGTEREGKRILNRLHVQCEPNSGPDLTSLRSSLSQNSRVGHQSVSPWGFSIEDSHFLHIFMFLALEYHVVGKEDLPLAYGPPSWT